jgi:hypothetical protein
MGVGDISLGSVTASGVATCTDGEFCNSLFYNAAS